MAVDADTVAECARHLVLISKDLREAGDVNIVRLSEDGVSQEYLTLADELWLIAVRLGAQFDGGGAPEKVQ